MTHTIVAPGNLIATYGGEAGSNADSNIVAGNAANSKTRRTGNAEVVTRSIRVGNKILSRSLITAEEELPATTILIEGFFATSAKPEVIDAFSPTYAPTHFNINKKADSHTTPSNCTWAVPVGLGTVIPRHDPAPFKTSSIVFLSGSYDDMYLSVYSPITPSTNPDATGYLTADPLYILPTWTSIGSGGAILRGYETCSDLVYRGPYRFADGTGAQMYSFLAKYSGSMAIFTCLLPSGYPYVNLNGAGGMLQAVEPCGSLSSEEHYDVVSLSFVSSIEAHLCEVYRLPNLLEGDFTPDPGNPESWYDFVNPACSIGRVGRYLNGAYTQMIDLRTYWTGIVDSSGDRTAFSGGGCASVEHDGGTFALLTMNSLTQSLDAEDEVIDTYMQYHGRLLWLHGTSHVELATYMNDLSLPYDYSDMPLNPHYAMGSVSIYDDPTIGAGAIVVVQDRHNNDIYMYHIRTYNGGASIQDSVTFNTTAYSLAQSVNNVDSLRIRMAASRYSVGGVDTHRIVIMDFDGRGYVTFEYNGSWGVREHVIVDPDNRGYLVSIQDKQWQETYMWKQNHQPLIV